MISQQSAKEFGEKLRLHSGEKRLVKSRVVILLVYRTGDTGGAGWSGPLITEADLFQ